VQEAEAQAIEKKGLAEALVIKERLLAEATGSAELGLAKVKVREAEAQAIEKQGAAEASASRNKLLAEATGITEKAAAMKNLDPASRAHEEFRIRLQAQREVALETLKTRERIAAEQAKILAEAFDDAKIQIVGGDGQFFDRFVKALSLGQSVETTLENSSTLRHVLGDYIGDSNGSTQLPKSISSVIANLMGGVDDASRKKLAELAARAKEMGIDDLQHG
jgi:hypothetical protein